MLSNRLRPSTDSLSHKQEVLSRNRSRSHELGSSGGGDPLLGDLPTDRQEVFLQAEQGHSSFPLLFQ